MTAAAENTKSHSNNNNDNKTKSREKEQVNDTKPGLLPPQALPTPPPPPPSTQDTSTLTSPWWSEESTETATIEKTIETSDNKNTSTSTTEPIASTTNSSLEKNIDATPSSATTTTTPIKTSSKTKKDKQPDSTILNISLLTFGRSSTKITPDHPWKERCFLLATTTELSPKRQKKDDNVENELEKVFDKAKECSMICFLRSSKQLTRDRLIKENNGDESKLPLTFAINPFYGTWITVVKTPKRCKEHLLQGLIGKKSFPDYYSMELGEELSYSGGYAIKAVQKTFTPLQHLTTKYIDSWKDGHQQAFFTKFCSSVQRGDAFYLVKKGTKKLIENVLGHDKNDKK